MILVEECVLRLDDPVDKHLPELADRQLLRTIDGPIDDTVSANQPITLRDLLVLRLEYGAIFDQTPMARPMPRSTTESGNGYRLSAIGYQSLPVISKRL